MGTLSPAVRYFKASLCAVAVAAAALLVWFGSNTFLLGFAGVLVGVALDSATRFVARITGVPRIWSLTIAVVLLAGTLLMIVFLSGPRVLEQVGQLRISVPAAWEKAQATLGASGWGRDLLERLPSPGAMLAGGGRAGGVFNAFSTVFSFIGSLVIIGFVGLYLAADPGLYRRGILLLTPKDGRKRAGEVLDHLGTQLHHWLVGRLSLMLFVGVSTALGLWVLHMPLIATLAILAALLDFIPNIGPLISAIPALLLASTMGVAEMAWVAGLYFTVQIVESYILQPLVQRRAVSLAPSLVLLAQVLAGSLFGALGLLLATPLTVVAMNLIQMLYVHDFLDKDYSGPRNLDQAIS